MADTDATDERQGGSDRTRMIVDTSEAIRRAVQLRKLKLPRGTTLSDVVNGVLDGTMPHLAKELAELKEFEPAPPKPKGKGGK